MSETGKLIRGLKFSLEKRQDGSFPKGIENNNERFSELQNYLKFVEGKDKRKVDEALINLRILQRSEKVNTRKVKELKEEIFSDKFNIKTEKVESVKKEKEVK